MIERLLFGSEAILRATCPACKLRALLNGHEETICCGIPVTGTPGRTIQVSTARIRRKQPSKTAQRLILAEQGNKCVYCDRPFGSVVASRATAGFTHIRLVWDHWVPWCLGYNNADHNFVAACQRCNAWKAGIVFDTIEEVREYVARKWDKELSRLGEAATDV